MPEWTKRKDVWVVAGLILVALAGIFSYVFSEEAVAAWRAFVELVTGS